MIQRIALLAGALGAAAVLAFALGLTNFVFAGPTATKTTADSQAVTQAADVGVAVGKSSGNGPGAGQGAQTQPKKVVDKVYIAPTPAPRVVHVTQPAPNTPSAPATTPTQLKAPTAAPTWHDDGPGQASEREGGRGGRQRGDD